MININELPHDVICIISGFLTIKDICMLQKSSKQLYNKIFNIQDFIISIHFNKLQKRGLGSKSFMYKLIHNIFLSFLHNFKSNKYNSLEFKNNVLKDLSTKFYNSSFTTQLNIPNKIFNKIFYWFVQNDYINISKYPNKFELLALFLFYQIQIYKDKTNFNMIIDFLESLNKDNYRYIRNNYYNNILDNLNSLPFILTYKQMYTMSNTVISIPIFKKMIGYKILDLSKCTFNDSYNFPNESILLDICKYKINYWKDPLVSHNYSEFKSLLYNDNKYYYELLTNIETRLLNDMIYIKNPTTNRRMRINGNYYKYTISSIYKNDYKTYMCLMYRLKKSQDVLRKRYFV